MNKVILHTIKAGERWDSIAYRYYGDVGEMPRLMAANPQIALGEQLNQGEQMLIPIISIQPSDQHQLPPWMQHDDT
ncbi:MAG: tail protein X [Acinetobacter sp.]|nr:tail protein X [Acinetobacter sp.]